MSKFTYANIKNTTLLNNYAYMPVSSNTQYLPAATKLGQGNIFTPVCDSVNIGGWSGPGEGVSPIFRGSLQFFGGVSNFSGGGWVGSPIFWGSPIFRGSTIFRGVSNFSGGLQFFRESPIFLGVSKFFFQFFFPKKILVGCTPPPRRSMRGRYPSYWNAFLLLE